MKQNITISAGVLAIVAVISIIYWWSSSKPFTVESIDRSIRAEVPQRATTSEVGTWFKRQGIVYKYSRGNFKNNEFVSRSGLSAKSIKSSVSGVKKDTSRSFVEDCNIYIQFYFDDEDKLIKHHIEELCSGL